MNKTKHYLRSELLLAVLFSICALPTLLANEACNNLSFESNNNQISISQLSLASKVEIIGQNTDWQVIGICNGDCPPTLSIPDLTASEYTVKINLASEQGYCYREEKILVNEVINESSQCQYTISPADANARILCFEVATNGITTLNMIENDTIVQKKLDKSGQIISSEVIGPLAMDSILIQNNQIIKKLADGRIAFTKDIPDSTLAQIPNIEAVTELTDGSFVLAGFQKFFNPDFGLDTNDSLLIVLTDINLSVQNTIVETENGGPNVIQFDRVIDLLPRPNNEFIIYYNRGTQGSVLIQPFKNFTKYQITNNQFQRGKNFSIIGSFFNQVNIHPCENFLLLDNIIDVVTLSSSSSSRGFFRFDLNELDIIESRAVGTRSVDLLGTTNFNGYSYKNNIEDTFSTLSVSYEITGFNNQADLSRMAIRFFNGTDSPSHIKIIPILDFDRVIRTGDTTCLILFEDSGELTALNPDCPLSTPTPITDCQSLQFIGSDNQITIEGLITNYSKVEIIGQNTDWQILPICDGDCPPTLSIPDLESGEYVVKVNQSGSDESYCYREEKIVVTEGNTNDTANCDNLSFSSANGQIIVEGLTAAYDKVEIIGRNTDWQVVTICDGDCADTQIIPDIAAGEYSVKVNHGGIDGSFCYREEVIIVEDRSGNRNRALYFEENLVLYPNPARDRVNIQLPNLPNQKVAIHIYNVFGQQVSTSSIDNLNQDALAIDLNSFESGIYVMTIQIDGLAKFSRRFVVEHLK